MPELKPLKKETMPYHTPIETFVIMPWSMVAFRFKCPNPNCEEDHVMLVMQDKDNEVDCMIKSKETWETFQKLIAESTIDKLEYIDVKALSEQLKVEQKSKPESNYHV